MSDRKQEAIGDSAAFHQLLQTQHELGERLEEIWQAIRASTIDVAAADTRRQYTHIPDYLVAGNTRLIAGGPGFGGASTLAAGTAAQILGRNTSRLGGNITNTGTNPVVLYLCEIGDQPSGEPIPQIWLGANGGSWDLRLGNVLWAGTVVALSAAGSSVAVAEV